MHALFRLKIKSKMSYYNDFRCAQPVGVPLSTWGCCVIRRSSGEFFATTKTPESHLVPKWQGLELLEYLDKALSRLKEFTDIMSASNYVTISALKPILHRLSMTKLAAQVDVLPLTAKNMSDILTRLQARYVDSTLKALKNVTSFLDARYKGWFFLNTERRNERSKGGTLEERCFPGV